MEFTSNFQAISQTYLAPKVIDTVLKGNILTLRLLGNSKPWRGRKLEKAVMVNKSNTGGSFAGLDVFPTTKPDTKRKLAFDPRFFEQSIVLEGTEEDVNAVDSQAAAMLATEAMEEAEISMLDSVADIIYGDGTGNGGKDFLGLQAIVDDGGEVATYGGLARATYTTLKGVETDVTGGLSDLATLAAADSATRYGNDRVTLHVTTEEKWSEYEALLQPTVRASYDTSGYPQATRFGVVATRSALGGDIGFDALYFRGVPVVADQKCPSDKWFGLNEKHLAWFGLPSKRFKPIELGNTSEIEGVYSRGIPKSLGASFSGWIQSQNQYGAVAYIILGGNLVSFNPNRHFVLNFSA